MKLQDEFNKLNNKNETYDSGEYVYFKPEQYATREVEKDKKEVFSQKETGVEEEGTGSANKTKSKVNNNKDNKVVDTLSKSVSKIAVQVSTTAIAVTGAVGAVAISDYVQKDPNVTFTSVNAGTDYVEFDVLANDMSADSSYFIKVASPNGVVYENIFKEKGECDEYEAAITEKQGHFVVSDLTPNFTYTISMSGDNGLGGLISYASTKVYTLRSGDVEVIFEANPYADYFSGCFSLEYSVLVSDYYSRYDYYCLYLESPMYFNADEMIGDDNYFRGTFHELPEGVFNLYVLGVNDEESLDDILGEYEFEVVYPSDLVPPAVDPIPEPEPEPIPLEFTSIEVVDNQDEVSLSFTLNREIAEATPYSWEMEITDSFGNTEPKVLSGTLSAGNGAIINFDKTDYYTQIKSDFTFGDLHWTDVYDCNFLLPENPMWIVSAHDDFDILEYTLNVANWLEIDESTVVVNLVYGGVSHTMSSTFLDPETLLVQFYKNELFDTYTIEIEYDYKDAMFNLDRHGSFKEENVASLFPTRTFAITNEGGGFDSDGNFIAQYSSNCYQNGLYFVIEYHYTINLLGGGTDSNTVSCVLPPNDTAVMSAPSLAVPEDAVSIEYYFTLDAQGPNGGVFNPGFLESEHKEEVIIANSSITVNNFYFDITDGMDIQLDVTFDYLSLNDPVFITIEDTDGGVYDLPDFDNTTMMKDAFASIQFSLPIQLSFQMKMYKFGTDELIAETSDLMEFKSGAASSISPVSFAQSNPGDYAVTFNNDDTMNIYQKSGFTPDSTKEYLHELIRFSYEENGFMKMKYLEISEFDQDVRLENVPMYNYYISYGVCAEIDGSNYFGNRVVPSGGIEIPEEANLWYYTSNNTELNVSLYSYVYDEPVFDFYVHTTLESKYDVEPIHYVSTGAYPMGYPDISYDFGAESTGKELAFDIEFKYMYGSDPLNVLNYLNDPYKGEPYKVISTSGSVSLGA